MRLEMDWKEGIAFEIHPPSGNDYVLHGDGEGGATPIEAFVGALAACSAMDVISILKKMRQPVESYRLDVEWERGPKDVYPRPVTAIKVVHHVKGQVDPVAVEKAVKLSDEKYCGVTASLRTPPKLEILWAVEG